MKRSLIWWELSWVTVELSAVLAALWLLLATQFSGLGAVALFGICLISSMVRVRHYATQTT